MRQVKALLGLALACATGLSASSLGATDHIDGSSTVNSPTIDLTDLYAFIVGEEQESLVVILNMITAAQPWEYPHRSSIFEMVFSGIKPIERERRFELLNAPRYRLSCRWVTQGAICDAPDGTQVNAVLDDIPLPAPIRIFAGSRSDPFFLNGLWASKLAINNAVPQPFDFNIINGLNVFSIVAEINIAQLMPDLAGQAIAIGADVRDVSSGRILDRVGRPEIANVALQSNEGVDLRDAINSVPALNLPEPLRGIVLARLRQNLDRYDAMDSALYSTDKDALSEILADDFLTIDPTLPCEGARYFDLEAAALGRTTATRCGGRPLAQDIVDSVYGLLIRGNAQEGISDGVSQPTRAALPDFPYLAEPSIGFPSGLLALVGRAIAYISVPGPYRTLILLVFAGTVIALLAFPVLFVRWMWRRRIPKTKIK